MTAINEQLDMLISIERVLEGAKGCLESSGGVLWLVHPEKGRYEATVPKEADLYVKFRAYIKEDLVESSAVSGDHYQAHVLIGQRHSDAEYGTLILYFALDGTVMTPAEVLTVSIKAV